MSSSQLNLSVTGMKCGGCIKNATEALSKLPGFENAEFDLETGTAKITGSIEAQSAIKALTDAGYPAELKSDS